MTLISLFFLTACTPEPEPEAEGFDIDAIASADSPTKRSEVRGVYHEGTNQILIFGGNNGPVVNQFPKAAYVDETWIFEPGYGWTAVEGEGPSARARYAIAVDEDGGRALLYGGRWREADASGDYTLLGDLWQFDFLTHEWTLLDDGTGQGAPDPRYYPNGAWDAATETFTVWGGNLNTDPLSFQVTGELWRWSDDGGWEDLTPEQSGNMPSDRSFLGSVHDRERNELVIFGGQIGNLSSTAFNDTYALNLDTLEWTRLHRGKQTAPSTRMHGPLVHDVERDRYVLFGGHTDRGDQNDVWAFDPEEETWSEVYIADVFTGERFGCLENESEVPKDYVEMDLSAPERRHNAMVVEAMDSVWIFGGMHAECSDHLDDTWRFDLESEVWTELISATSGESCARRGDDCACLCL